jgi:hypothetical protein
MPKSLGTLTLTCELAADGSVDVKHSTVLSEHLNVMQSAMSEAEKKHAAALRRLACRAAATFFMFVSNPDAMTEATDG